MSRRLAPFLSAVLLLPLLSSPAARTAPPFPRAPSAPQRRPDTVAFLAFGDQGTGGPGQRRVAASMEKVIADAPVDFTLLLGDNFYPDGLSGPSDPLFDTLFRAVYSAKAFPFPFYPTLGNHEYRTSAGAVLKLGTRDARWRMPARRYSFTQTVAGGTVQFVGLDTTPFDDEKRVAADPDVGAPLAGVAEELASAAGARWRFAFGHHPLLSSGVHGESEGMMRIAGPILAAGGVDLYLCGHEHLMESLAPVLGVPQIISGGGGGWDRATPVVRVRAESLFRLTGGGFVRGEVKADAAVFTFYDVDGVARHTRTLYPRATQLAGGKR